MAQTSRSSMIQAKVFQLRPHFLLLSLLCFICWTPKIGVCCCFTIENLALFILIGGVYSSILTLTDINDMSRLTFCMREPFLLNLRMYKLKVCVNLLSGRDHWLCRIYSCGFGLTCKWYPLTWRHWAEQMFTPKGLCLRNNTDWTSTEEPGWTRCKVYTGVVHSYTVVLVYSLYSSFWGNFLMSFLYILFWFGLCEKKDVLH